uniref:Uncharacterized protein n=1 Tax=Lactuca sativa TaxID=4236 RepID=A0A9R1XBV0_LACSA|nr:hypothetical protein LSAT_V11C500297140 [Lactuca sativa]
MNTEIASFLPSLEDGTAGLFFVHIYFDLRPKHELLPQIQTLEMLEKKQKVLLKKVGVKVEQRKVFTRAKNKRGTYMNVVPLFRLIVWFNNVNGDFKVFALYCQVGIFTMAVSSFIIIYNISLKMGMEGIKRLSDLDALGFGS